MSEVESLVHSPSGQRQLRLMEVLSGFEADRDNQVDIEALEKNPDEWGFSSTTLDGDLEALKAWGWVEYWPTLEGIGSVILKQPGIDAADEFKAIRSDRKLRNQEARKAVLLWLEDEYHEGRTSPNISEFTSSKFGNFMGDPYSEREVDAATLWCRDAGYLEGTAAFGGPVVRPTITNKGLAYVEGADSTASGQDSRGGDVYNIHNTGAFNWAMNSPNASLNISMSQEEVGRVRDMVDSVRAMIGSAGVSDEVVADAEIIAAEIEDEISSAAPEGGKVKALGEKLGELAATGTVTAIVNALSAVIQQGIAGL